MRNKTISELADEISEQVLDQVLFSEKMLNRLHSVLDTLGEFSSFRDGEAGGDAGPPPLFNGDKK